MNTVEFALQYGKELRRDTFAEAMRILETLGDGCIVETGCYRGIDCDGMSTAIFANACKETGRQFISFDLSRDHVVKARRRLEELGLQDYAIIHCIDSLVGLQDCQDSARKIALLYLDSFDHDPGNPLPCQQHQEKEIQIAWPCLIGGAVIILDDNVPGTGGKVALSSAFLENKGCERIADTYQRVYVKP